MPISKKSSSAPKKSGDKFLTFVAVVGFLVLGGIWFNYQQQEVTEPARTSTIKKTPVPTPVFVMNKTNPAARPTNVFSLAATPAQPVVVRAPVPVQTNSIPVTTNSIPVKTNSAIPPVVVPEVRKNMNLPEADPTARPVQNILEAQIALARRGISAGSIDGLIGSQTRAALRAFQRSENIPVSGELDAVTKTKLLLTAPLYTDFIVTTNDLARLQPVGAGWLAKSRQTRLDYETILELAAEKSGSHPAFLKQLNPLINWTNVSANTTLRLVNLERAKPKTSAAFIRIHLAERNLQAFDANTNLLAHFPCSIAQRMEKRPVGELCVAVIAPDPDYTFAPESFPESAEARQLKTKLILPPGPNNPVGTVWIGLDKPGYGIHGTPRPEDVGRTESHGCFRLANWNAEYLLQLVKVGLPVFVTP